MILSWCHMLRDKETGKVKLYYTDSLDPQNFINEFDENIDNKEEIALDQWDSEMVKDLLENMLEDANRHSLMSLPEIILNSLCEAGISDKEKSKIMRTIMQRMYDEDIV